MSHRIEYMRLDDLLERFMPDNPKDHDLGALDTSFNQFGFVETPLVDERTGKLVAGHGRLSGLWQKYQGKQAALDGLQTDADGMWLVPTLRGVAFKSDAQLKAYLIASNRMTERGGWDNLKLAELLQELANDAPELLDATGFDGDDLDALLTELGDAALGTGAEDAGAQVDKAEELRAKWNVQRGDIFEVGAHRVMCGDSTNADDVAALMAGESPRLMVTDPPYGVNYDANWRTEAAEKGLLSSGDRRVAKVSNDDRVDWSEAYQLAPCKVAYVWHAALHTTQVDSGLRSAGFETRSQIIWAKPSLTISRGHYHWQHEPCWYAVKKGCTAAWAGDRTQTTVWNITLDKNTEGGHSTQKPVECMARPIRNHEGDVYDPFLGSGTTLVACEQTGRRGRGMELEPKYVAVTLERLQAMGLEPRKLESKTAPVGAAGDD